MTRQKSYSEKHGGLLSGSFFSYSLRQNWPTLLLLIIAFFFIVNVPLLLMLGEREYNYYYYMEHFGDAVRYYKNLDSLVSGIGMTATVVTAGLALILGLGAFKFETKKVDAGFWHSIPLRRETIYFNELTVDSLYFVIALALNGAFSLLILNAKTAFRFEDGMIYVRFLLSALLVYAVIYSLTVLASLFCGTMPARFASVITIFHLPVGIYLAVLFAFSLGSNYASVGAGALEISKRICFDVRVAMLYGTPFTVGEIILYVIVALLAVFLGMLVYKKRPVESSGTPIFWKLPNAVVKYFLIMCSATGLGAILYAISDSWLIFGLVSGAFLGFIFINALLNKSFKAMFKGFKWFLVFALIYALVFLGLVFDPLNFDEYIPSSFVTESITVRDSSYYSKEYEFTDKDDIDAIRAAMKEVFKYGNEHIGEERKAVDPYDYDYLSDYAVPEKVYYDRYVNVVVRSETIWGIPIEKQVSLYAEAFAPLADAIKKSNAFGGEYDSGMLYTKTDGEIGSVYAEIFDYGVSVNNYSDMMMLADYLSSVKKPGLAYPAVGSVNISTMGSDIGRYYMTETVLIPNDEKVVNEVLGFVLPEIENQIMYYGDDWSYKYGYDDEKMPETKLVYGKDNIETYILSFIDSLYVYGNGKTAVITDKDQIRQMMMSSTKGRGDMLTSLDPDYYYEIKYTDLAMMCGFFGGGNEWLFYDGLVPEFVTGMLGK